MSHNDRQVIAALEAAEEEHLAWTIFRQDERFVAARTGRHGHPIGEVPETHLQIPAHDEATARFHIRFHAMQAALRAAERA